MDSQSSSSSCGRIWKNDVFLSFNEDSQNFGENLVAALQATGLNIFRDGEKHEPDDPIPPHVLKAIEESKIFLVIYSKCSLTSIRGLDEIAKIGECINVPGYTVFPIFYNVKPSEISYYAERLEEAFGKREKEFRGQVLENLQRWGQTITAVTKVSNSSASPLVLRSKEVSQQVIDSIVKMVVNQLSHTVSSVAVDHLVGMQSRVENLEKLLELGSNVVQFVGICGMGGVGKTTLAKVVYDKISSQFDSCCFLADSSEVFMHHGLIHLQQQLLAKIQGLENVDIKDVREGITLVRNSLRSRKTLIVLDDVNQRRILTALVGKTNWFGAGSRIIITTRDECILKHHEVDKIYKVELLNDDEALRLFCKNRFKCDYPPIDYEDLTNSVLEYAKGLPLAIKSMASLLLYRDDTQWTKILAKMQKIPHFSIVNILRRSFDGLNKMEKEVFLHMACFFEGEEINYVKKILSHLGFHFPGKIIAILNEKSLLTISSQRIQMHPLLQEMGREIVRQESPMHPEKRTRLWLYGDFRHVMETNSETKKVKAVVLSHEEQKRTLLKAEALSNGRSFKTVINEFAAAIASNVKKYSLTWNEHEWNLGAETISKMRTVIKKLNAIGSSYEDEGTELIVELRIVSIYIEAVVRKLEVVLSNVEDHEGNKPLSVLEALTKINTVLTELDVVLCNVENYVEKHKGNPMRLFEALLESSIVIKINNALFSHDEHDETPLRAEALSKMSHLRLLILHKVNFSGSLNCLSEELRYISWDEYPFTSLPSSFEPPKLVELIMPHSSITHLWKDKKMLPRLRSINLRDSKDLVEMPDFGGLPNLASIDLEGCTALLHLQPSIAILSKLKFLNLRNCISLISIPNKLFDLCDLEILNLAGCSKFVECLNFDPLKSLVDVELLTNEEISSLKEMGKPILDCGINREYVDDVATQTIAPSGECAFQDPSLKSKRKAMDFQKGDATQARAKASKVKKHRASNTEATSSNTIAKCVVELEKIEGVSNNSYTKALEKFKDPYWREVFLTMSCDRKKVWLHSLL